MKRRNFILLTAINFFSLTLFKKFAQAEDDIALVGESSDMKVNLMAKSIKYCPDLSQPTLSEKYPCPPLKADEICSKCDWYLEKKTVKIDGKEVEVGKCKMLLNKYVRGAGTCAKWAPTTKSNA